MIRKGWLIVCSLIMVFAVMGSVSADRTIQLVVNGQTLSPDVSPQLIQDRVMVPVRWVAEALGAKVDWDGPNQTVSIDTEDSANQQRQVELLQSWITPDSSDEMAKTWAEAVKKRNGAVQFALMSPALQQQTEQEFAELGWVTGVSSPWVDSYMISDAVDLDGASRLYEVVFQEATSTGDAGTVTVKITVSSSDQQWQITDLQGSDDAAAITALPPAGVAPPV